MTPADDTSNEILRTRQAQMFPKLTAPQVARLEAHGTRVAMHAGATLIEVGDKPTRLFVVIDGAVDLLLSGSSGYASFYTLTPGDFTGEMSALRGSATVVRERA